MNRTLIVAALVAAFAAASGASAAPAWPGPPTLSKPRPGVAVPSQEFPYGDIPGDISDPRPSPPPPPPPPSPKGQAADSGIGDLADADAPDEAGAKPLAKPPTRVGKAQNRRVEVKLSK